MAYELTYSDNLTPWFTIQPDIQYIIDPDTNPALQNAWSWEHGLRLNFEIAWKKRP